MKIVLGAKKAAAKQSRGRTSSGVRNYKAHYKKYGRTYYERNRSKILKKAKARYAANKGKYKRMRKRWLAKTQGGKRPLYLSGKGAGRRPVFPRLKAIHRKNTTAKIGRQPARSGRAFKPVKGYQWEGAKKRAAASRKAWRKRKAAMAAGTAAPAKKGKKKKSK